MAIRDDFFTALTNGAKWDVGVSINRTNPLPLDQYSVFQTETALDEYIAGAFAYPGQIVAVVGETATTIYYLDQNKAKQPVGIIPKGDDKTIEVTAAGAISLLGASGAANGTLPMIGEDGTLTWKTLEDIGAGDGNDNTTYVFTILENGKGFSVKTYFNGQPAKDIEGNELPAQEILLDVYTTTEIDNKLKTITDEIGTVADGEVAATGLYKAIADEKTRAENAEKALGERIDGIDFIDSDELTSALALYEKTTDVNGKLDLKANAADVYTKTETEGKIDDAIKGVLGEDVNEAYDTFKELQVILDGDETGAKGLIDKVADNTTAIATEKARAEAAEKANADAIAILNGDATTEGSVAKAIADANLDQYASDDDLAGVKSELEGKIDEKATKATTLAGYGITDAYTTTQIDDLINNINQGNQESASAVNTKLENYKTSNDQRVGVIETKLNTVEENAEKNIIEVVKLNGTALDVSAEDRSVDVVVTPATLDVYTTTETDAEVKKATDAAAEAKALAQTGVNNAAAAQAKADGADAKATTNEGAISTLSQTVGSHGTTIGEHTTKIGNLETTVAGHGTTIASHTESITQLTSDIAKKAEQTALDAAVARVATNETEITTLKETTIPGINTEIGKKANSADVYTKTQIGTIEEGKTLIEMINAAADTTALEARVKANEDAIAGIADTYVDNDELSAAVKVETDRAEAKEKELADAITANTAAINSILGNEDDINLNSIAELAAWINEHGTDAEEMVEAIGKNTSDIAALTTTVNDNKTNTDAAIKAITDNYLVKNVDNTTLQLVEGVASVKAVSTDLLVQGAEEVIFSAGNASGYTVTE